MGQDEVEDHFAGVYIAAHWSNGLLFAAWPGVPAPCRASTRGAGLFLLNPGDVSTGIKFPKITGLIFPV
jgi:hypothetical protein